MTNAQTTGSRNDVFAALKDQGLNVLHAKREGGFFIEGEGFLSLAAARTRTGIAAPARQRRERQAAYGDFATIAALNGIRPK